ncbi:MAG: hypothetical protein VYC11_02370, partial [Candidatus Thermoplasmatota archaeon]|nr:hypothetical protein [Candidatus Thermoplasmatota archaeon]
RKQNGMIALAGPLSNLVLWLIAIPAFVLMGDWGILGQIIFLWLVANSILGAFNMLPFGPLDGKKIKTWSEPVFWTFLGVFLLIVYVTIFKQNLLLSLA